MIFFCCSTLPVSGILSSTLMPSSLLAFSRPLAAIFQNSLLLLVMKASLRVVPAGT